MPSPRVSHARKPIPQGFGTLWSLTNDRWSADDVNRLLSIARQAEGEISGISAASWWPAFLLTLLDTAVAPQVLLSVGMGDYRQGRIAVGLVTYELHPLVIDAIDNLSHRSQVFPWPWSVTTLGNRFAKLVAMAGIPTPPKKPFAMLRDLARQQYGLLDQLDLVTDYTPIPIAADPTAIDEEKVDEAEHDPKTLVGYARQYPDLRLELKNTSAYLLLVVARMFTRYHKRPILLSELATPLVLPWLKSIVANRRSPATANSHRTSLLTLWTMAHEQGNAPAPPNKVALPVFRVPRKSPISWRPEQLQILLEICDRQRGCLRQWPTVRRRDFWFSLILFLYESGARIGAALAIAPADVDLENRIVILRSTSAKTLLEQPIRISETTAEAIRVILDPNRERVWPCGRWRNYLYTTLKGMLKIAGLPTDRMSKFHRIRRTNATQTAIHGSLDMARQQLGHTSVQMTIRSYIDTTVLNPIQAVDVLPRIASARPVNGGTR